jgi:hypothetical protein
MRSSAAALKVHQFLIQAEEPSSPSGPGPPRALCSGFCALVLCSLTGQIVCWPAVDRY